MLSDQDLRAILRIGELSLVPGPRDVDLQPASIDLRLGELERDGKHHNWTLPPQEFRLGSTLEIVTLSAHICGQVVGKSSWARRGLIVEAAGLVDPGFSGQLTLELFNMTQKPITLTEGVPICQLVIFALSSPALRRYGDPGLNSHYQHQRGPTEAFGGE